MKSDPDKKEENSNRLVWIVISISIAMLAIWFAAWFVIPTIYPPLSEDPSGIGQLGPGISGDMFGSINALFSGFALIGVILAVYLQSKELALQREELRLQRVEMAKTAKEMENQTELIGQQLETMRDSYNFQLKKDQEAAKPVLKLDGNGGHKKQRDVTFKNIGGLARNLEITVSKEVKIHISPRRKQIDTGDKFSFSVVAPTNVNDLLPSEWVFVLHYEDTAGSTHYQDHYQYSNGVIEIL